MKILFMLLFFVSCNANPNNPIVKESSGLYRYEDSENDVTCYRVSGYEGISCLK